MQLSTKSIGNRITVLSINGRMLGGPDTDEMDQQLEKALQQRQGLIVDLTNCTWINSTGLCLLIHYHKKYSGAALPLLFVLRENDTLGGRSESQNAEDEQHCSIHRILVLSRLTEVFRIHPTMAAAIADMQQQLQ